MRQKKVKIECLKYAALNKTTNKVSIFRFKKSVAEFIGVSVRTLDRNMPYETDNYAVYEVKEVLN